ncbi:MAG: hypothetical protein JO285_12085 [Kutzneria sp.]|nr:hypothetical protein [Kutzneria sp.]
MLQLMSGIDLLRDPQHTSAVGTQAVILILLFAFGIDRAWALIGGLSTRHARALARRQHPTPQWDLSRSGTIDRTRTNP